MTLTTELDYRALSYEWGSADNPKTIILDGKVVRVRQNLWWALLFLRKDGQNGQNRFWVDAICINQGDEEERSRQVSLMGKIYKYAKEVICWLGRGNENKSYDKAMDFLVGVAERNELPLIEAVYKPDLRQNADLNERKYKYNPTSNTGAATSQFKLITIPNSLTEHFSTEPSNLPLLNVALRSTATTSIAKERVWTNPPSTLFDNSALSNIEALCSHSYWRRTWIIQEIVLAQSVTIRLGDRIVDGEAFNNISKAVLLYHLTEEGTLALAAPRVMDLRLKYARGIKIRLIKLIEISEKSSCQDLRDKAYAMMGLAYDCQNNELLPDYSKSLAEVYKDVVLDHCYRSSLDQHGVSWNLVEASQLVQRCFWSISGSVLEQDGSQRNLDTLYGPDCGQFLHIGGVYYGSVAECGQSDDSGMWWAHPGFVKPIESSRSFASLQKSFKVVGLEIGYASSLFPSLSSLLPSLPEKEKSDISGPDSIQPFVLDNKLCIFAPGRTKRGDIVCRFFNSDIVAVFRRTSDTYALIGRAMILDERNDVSTFGDGWFLSDGDVLGLRWQERNIVLCHITPNAFQQLTSPHY
jgi:hypothetical protein